MSKAQSEIIENVVIVFFGVILLAAILTISYNFYSFQVKNEIENNLRQLGILISDSVLKLYEIGKNSKIQPKLNEAVKIAEIDLKLPPKISGRNYEVILIQGNPIWIKISNISIDEIEPSTVRIPSRAKIILRTKQEPFVEVEQDLANMDVFLQGGIENGLNSLLSYYRCNVNGNLRDSIVLGEEIIIQANEVS